MENLKNKTYGLLRWSEQYTKTDMVYLAKGGFWITFAQIFVSLSSFILAIAFAHFVSKEDYGEYKYIISLIGIMSTFTLSGLNSAVLRSVSAGFDKTLQYAFWKNIKWSAVFFLLAFSSSIYYFVNSNYSIGISMLIAGSLWPFFMSTNLYNPYLIAKKDFKRNAIYFEIIGNLFPVTCLIIAMLFTNHPSWLISTYIISNTLIGLVLYKITTQVHKPSGGVDKTALNYSKHLSFINILSGIASNIDQVLVFHYIGATQLAIYNFAIAIPNQTKGPLKGLSNLMFPKFVERDEKEIHKNIYHKYMIMFLIGLTLAILYIILAPYIFGIFFPQYSESILYSQIFAISFIAITFNPADTYLTAKKKIREQYINATVNSIIQIVTIFIAILYWGLIGLIIARVITRLISNFISFLLYEYSTRN